MGTWSLSVNVAGVKPFEPGAFQRLPTGAYRVSVKDTELEQKDVSKHPALRFDVVVEEEGDFKGVQTRVYVGTDWTKEGNRKHLRSLLLGVGANPQALDSGVINIDQSMVIGKMAYIYVEEAPEGEKRADGKKAYDNRNFIAPAYYEKWRTENAIPQGPQANQPAQPAGAAPTPGGLAGLAGALNTGGAQGGAAFPQGGASNGAPNLFSR